MPRLFAIREQPEMMMMMIMMMIIMSIFNVVNVASSSSKANRKKIQLSIDMYRKPRIGEKFIDDTMILIVS